MVQLEYASVIGCLKYLMQCTRPYISFAISKMSRFTSNLNGEHWKGITWIFYYLLKKKS